MDHLKASAETAILDCRDAATAKFRPPLRGKRPQASGGAIRALSRLPLLLLMLLEQGEEGVRVEQLEIEVRALSVQGVKRVANLLGIDPHDAEEVEAGGLVATLLDDSGYDACGLLGAGEVARVVE